MAIKSVIQTILASTCLGACAALAQAAASPATQAPEITRNQDGSNTATLHTYSHEPLRYALLQINREYGWDVNFEQAPVVYPSEIVDDETPERRAAHPNARTNYEQNGRPFHSTFKEIGLRQADEDIVLAQLLSDYNTSPNPGRYELMRTSSGGYSVVGTQYKNQDGVEQAFTSPLSCPISITIPPTDLPSALTLVAGQVNQSCRTSLSAEYGALLFKGVAVSGTYSHQSAREVIDLLLLQAKVCFYYSLAYAPVEQTFYLTIEPVFRRAVQVDGGITLEPVPNPRVVNPK